jgi:hypothetical protein
LLTYVASHLYVTAQLGNPETPLGRIVRAGNLDVLLVHHAYLHAFQSDVPFAGHAHERHHRSVGQTQLQQRKRVGSLVLSSQTFRFVADDDVS